jgi:DNA-binding XRE family transcriptional regulator
MKKSKKKEIEAAGWKIGTAEDFLDLSAEEAALVEIRLRLARSVRELRLEHRLTQGEMAKRIGSSQSRVAKMEKADPSVSLDLMVRSIVALGKSPEEVGRVISAKAA